MIEYVVIFLILLIIVLMSPKIYRKIKLAKAGKPKIRKIKVPKKSVKKVEKEVIGMVRCEYCGSLMPQTSTVCPNCGAPRKK